MLLHRIAVNIISSVDSNNCMTSVVTDFDVKSGQRLMRFPKIEPRSIIA